MLDAEWFFIREYVTVLSGKMKNPDAKTGKQICYVYANVNENCKFQYLFSKFTVIFLFENNQNIETESKNNLRNEKNSYCSLL